VRSSTVAGSSSSESLAALPSLLFAEVSSAFPSAPRSAATDQPEEELWDARCNRNDGKRWRCKSAAVPGYLFCARHVAWSARQRQPRAARKQMNKNCKDVFEPAAEEEEAEDKHVDDGSAGKPPQLVRRRDDGFYYYGGFQPGGRKRARGGGPGPVGGMNQT
jgi:hypothetical protein